MALFGVVQWLLKPTTSRAVTLWCSGTLMLGAGQCLGGLGWNTAHSWLDAMVLGLCVAVRTTELLTPADKAGNL